MQVKPRSTLSMKIFFVAFLNLALLGLVFTAFLRLRFRSDIDSFLLAPVQDRIVSLARELALELGDADRAEWEGVVARHARKYGAMFYLMDESGAELAGPKQRLPPSIESDLAEATGRHRRPPPEPGVPRGVRSEPREPSRESIEHPSLFRRITKGPTVHWFGVRIPLPGRGAPDGVLIAGMSSWTSALSLMDLRLWLVVAGAVILVSVVCWFPLVRGLTRSIAHVTRATGLIAEGQFDIQLPVRRRDEIGQLSASINLMAARLGIFVRGQKRFLGDTAHELCSPLARIQVELGILERTAAAEQPSCIADLRDDVQQMSTLVHEALSFSKASRKPADINLEPVNIAAVVKRVLEREATDGVRISTSIDESLRATAHADLLFRAMANVVCNAIRYAGSAGPIEISAAAEDRAVVLRVADCGPGLPENELEAVFEPFYRVDTARDPASGGIGLGLAIAKTCVESCRGTVHCHNRRPTGLEVEIRLEEA